MDDDYDYCYECTGYGDNYYEDDDGELVCRCPECPNNRAEQDGICRNVWLCGAPCDGYREKCKLRPTYNSLQKTTEKVVHKIFKRP